MRKIGFVPYKNSIKELLPSSFKIQKQVQKRKMFISMLNETLDSNLKIHCTNFNINLKNIFMTKIYSFFQIQGLKPHRTSKIKKFYLQDSLLFEQFFKHSNSPLGQFLSKRWEFDAGFKVQSDYEHPVSSLIKLIFNGKEMQMMLNLDVLFTQTVFNRIKPTKDAEVSLDMPYIHISEKGRTTRILPQWKKLNPKNLSRHNKQIINSFQELKKEEIDQCYLLYPKNDNFKKHIVLKDTQENRVKLVPYSFSFINKTKRVQQVS